MLRSFAHGVSMPSAERTPLYFRLVVRLLRPFPNFDIAFMRPLRAKAVALLRLAPGSRVLDLGCGPGGSFPFLQGAVGPTGQVVGVEISPDVAVNARLRINAQQWSNVEVLEGDARQVSLPGTFHGALMFGAPDVFADPAAVANLLPHLEPKARVVFFGAKTSQRRGGWLLNPLLRALFPKLTFPTTPIPDDAPWQVLAPHLTPLHITEYFFGWMFLAEGTYVGESVPEVAQEGAAVA